MEKKKRIKLLKEMIRGTTLRRLELLKEQRDLRDELDELQKQGDN